MKTARINYVGSSDVEYTEIRPIRPNQSVVLAGLGITGNKATAWRKDRGYRSTQGAGYSDGLVIHSALNSRPNTQDGWPTSRNGNKSLPVNVKKSSLYKENGRSATSYQRHEDQYSRNSTSFNHYDRKSSMFPNYDIRDSRLLYEDQPLPTLPSSSPPYKSGTSPTNTYRVGSTAPSEVFGISPTRSPMSARPKKGGKSVVGTYDMFFDQHLQNIVNIEEDPTSRISSSTPGTGKMTDRSTPGTGARYREASCQTPTDLNIRISPLIPSRLTNCKAEPIPRILEEGSQTYSEEEKIILYLISEPKTNT